MKKNDETFNHNLFLRSWGKMLISLFLLKEGIACLICSNNDALLMLLGGVLIVLAFVFIRLALKDANELKDRPKRT